LPGMADQFRIECRTGMLGEHIQRNRSDVLDVELSKLYVDIVPVSEQVGKEYHPTKGYLEFANGNIKRLEDLPQGLNTIGQIERHLFEIERHPDLHDRAGVGRVTGVVFTDY